MFVVGKILQVCMVRGVVPTDLDFVVGRKPVITVSHQSAASPVFGDPQVGAIFEVENQPNCLSVEFDCYNPGDMSSEFRFDLKQPLSR